MYTSQCNQIPDFGVKFRGSSYMWGRLIGEYIRYLYSQGSLGQDALEWSPHSASTLVDWVTGWQICWLVGWLVGWLVECSWTLNQRSGLDTILGKFWWFLMSRFHDNEPIVSREYMVCVNNNNGCQNFCGSQNLQEDNEIGQKITRNFPGPEVCVLQNPAISPMHMIFLCSFKILQWWICG